MLREHHYLFVRQLDQAPARADLAKLTARVLRPRQRGEVSSVRPGQSAQFFMRRSKPPPSQRFAIRHPVDGTKRVRMLS